MSIINISITTVISKSYVIAVLLENIASGFSCTTAYKIVNITSGELTVNNTILLVSPNRTIL